MIKKLLSKKPERWLTWEQYQEAVLLWEGINKLSPSFYSLGGFNE